ncbi:MAG: hypothetical protein SPI77_02015 [Corynebacterium sp.]|nr:hypothetical protein [Corynebacterium sp.]
MAFHPFRFPTTRTLLRCAISVLATCGIVGVTALPASAQNSPAPLDQPLYNYHWVNDPVSQFLALHAGPVLRRAENSFFHAPDMPQEAIDAQARGKALYGPGTPIFTHASQDAPPSALCTLGIAGYDSAGRPIGITAAHCGAVGAYISSADAQNMGTSGRIIGANKVHDYAVILFDAKKVELTRTYNGVTVNSIGGQPRDGEPICKRGIGTGTTCGTNLMTSDAYAYSQVCSTQGDSGAPLLRGDQLVGFISGGLRLAGNADLSCRTPIQGMLFTPAIGVTADTVMTEINENPKNPGAGLRLP